MQKRLSDTLAGKALIIADERIEPTTIFFLGVASEEEIKSGEYIEVYGYKISSNPRKHAMIKDVKI